jgi:hypothetical protein
VTVIPFNEIAHHPGDSIVIENKAPDSYSPEETERRLQAALRVGPKPKASMTPKAVQEATEACR